MCVFIAQSVVQHRDRFVLSIVRDFMVSLLIKMYRTILWLLFFMGVKIGRLYWGGKEAKCVTRYGVQENIWN